MIEIPQDQIVMFTTPTCQDCRNAKRFFSRQGIPFVEIDVSQSQEAIDLMQRLNGGYNRVPTILFPSDQETSDVLIEPTTQVLARKIGKH